MHDPLTIISAYNPNLVEYVDVCIAMDTSGQMYLTDFEGNLKSQEIIKNHWKFSKMMPVDEYTTFRVLMSLEADYGQAREVLRTQLGI